MHALNTLYDQCLLRSTERSETHAVIANELCDHRLHWHGGAADTRLYRQKGQQLSLYALQYGSSVNIFPELYQGFSLVHFSLAQAIEIESDGKRQTVSAQRAIITTPSKGIRLHWAQASEQLILRIPHAALARASKQFNSEALYRRFLHAPSLLLDTTRSQHWRQQLEALMSWQHPAYYPAPSSQPWIEHAEQGLALFLLMQFADSTTPPLKQSDPLKRFDDRTPTHIKLRLERLHEYVCQNLTNPIGLADMAQAAALSERQLNAVCQTYFNNSPVAWLRQLRLHAIRQHLQSNPQADISSIALMHGFAHLGRFAASYRAQFGELPSTTLKITRSG